MNYARIGDLSFPGIDLTSQIQPAMEAAVANVASGPTAQEIKTQFAMVIAFQTALILGGVWYITTQIRR